jgi:hypothetical protein
MQPGALRRAPAALAGDDLVAVGSAAHRPHDDRLNDAALTQEAASSSSSALGNLRRGLRAFGRSEPVGSRR